MFSCIYNHKVSLSKAYHIAEPGDTSLQAENEAWADYFSNYLTSGENPMEPLSDFYYPMILDLLDEPSVRSKPGYIPSEHQIAGILSQSVYWRDMIKNILPQGSNGYLTVFKSPCNPTFTYEINGQAVRYLGVGDAHDTKYDDMAVSSSLQDLMHFDTDESSKSNVPFDMRTCPWTVVVRPSQVLEDKFVTSNPILLSVGTVAIFLFVAAMFSLYDFWVERRQRIVMTSAIQTNNVCKNSRRSMHRLARL